MPAKSFDEGASEVAKDAAAGAAAVSMAATAATAAAVGVGTLVATGAVEAGAVAAGAAAGAAIGAELGPIGAAAGAIVGLMVALGGSAANDPMPFASSPPIELYKTLVGMPNPILRALLQDQEAAVALTLWVADPGAIARLNLWLEDFLEVPANHASILARQYMAQHEIKPDFDAMHLTSDPTQQTAATIARIFYTVNYVPATGAHQYEELTAGLGQTDADYGGPILTSDSSKTGLDKSIYFRVLAALARPAPVPKLTLRIPTPKKGSAMHEALTFAKEKAEEAVEVVYKDGAVTKVGKGLGIAAGILVLAKILKGRR